jgi:hypothetical protein
MNEDIERGPAFSRQPVGPNLLSQPTDEQRQAVAAVLRGLADQIEDKNSTMPLRLGWIDTEVNRPGPRTLQSFVPFGDDIVGRRVTVTLGWGSPKFGWEWSA